MKKVHWLIFSIILSVFVIITLFKIQPAQKTFQAESELYLAAEREKIHLFWKFYRLANTQRIAGKLDSALTNYQKASAYRDKHEDTLYYLGNVYLDLGFYNEAQKSWNKLIEINPQSARAYFQLGNLHLNNTDKDYFDIEMAGECFQKVLKINQEESGSIYYTGQIELIQQNYATAHHLFESLSGSNYNNLYASFFKGFIDWKRGQRDMAISQVIKAVELSKIPETKPASGEGDTKLGKPLYNLMSPERKSLFYDFIHDIKEITQPLILEERYRKLDQFLTELRSRI